MFNPSEIAPLFKNLKDQQQLWLGYSGGLDSQVLLFALNDLINHNKIPIKKTQLHAVHINHGWSQQAFAWAEHCQQVCHRLNIHYHAITIDAKPKPGQSPEAYARAARYKALATLLNKNDILLTAHQQDDQAETLLLQLFRGAGVTGLASMPQLTVFANGWHLRPLLNYSRADLLNYAQRQQLQWIEDESNANTRYTRNFLRHTILPKLKQRWPQINSTIARTAEHCAATDKLLDELGQADLMTAQSTQPHILSINALAKFSEIRQKNLLRYWFSQLNIPLPSAKQLHHILQDVLTSKKDACPKVIWGQHVVQRHQDKLYLCGNLNLHNPNHQYTWDLTKPLLIPQIGVFNAYLTPGQGIRADILKLGQLTIRFRQSGERCRPIGRQGSHPLKKLLQEWQIPPWERDRIPLLYCNEQLAAVIGYCICSPFAADPSTSGWIIHVIDA